MPFERMRGTARAIRAGALVLALVSVLLADAAPSGGVESRAVTVSKAQGLNGWDQVTVRWSGFPPNEAVTINQYDRFTPIKWTRLAARSGPTGAGESTFVIGLSPNGCLAGDDCWLTVSSCAGQPADRSWLASAQFWKTPSGPGWASARLSIGEQPVLNEDDDLVNPALRPPPVPKVPDDPRPSAPTVTRPVPTVTSGTSQARLLEAWRDDLLLPPAINPLNLDITPINSPKAIEDLVGGFVDFAVVASPPSPEDLAALERAGRPATVIPLIADALVVAHDRRTPNNTAADGSGFDLREMSAATLAAHLKGNSGEALNTSLSKDNRGCDVSNWSRDYTETQDRRVLYRTDQSSANHLVQSWLIAKGLLAGEASTTLTLGAGGEYLGVNGGDPAIVRFITYAEPGDALNPIERRIAYLSRSTALRRGVATFDLRTPAGSVVVVGEPTITSALAGRQVGTDGVVDLDPAKVADDAWPLTFVSYAVVPKRLSARFTEQRAAVVRDFLTHALSDKGQQRASLLGYAALPTPIREAARGRIGAVGATAAATTTTAVTTDPTSVPTTSPHPPESFLSAATTGGPATPPADGPSAAPSASTAPDARSAVPVPGAGGGRRGRAAPAPSAGTSAPPAPAGGEAGQSPDSGPGNPLVVIASRVGNLLAPGWSPGAGAVALLGALALLVSWVLNNRHRFTQLPLVGRRR